MNSQTSLKFGRSYDQLLDGDFHQSVATFSQVMDDNALEILDLAESESAAIPPPASWLRPPPCHASTESLASDSSAVSLFSAASSASDTGAPLQVAVLERAGGHIRPDRLKRAFRRAVLRRSSPLRNRYCAHLKRSLLSAIDTLADRPDQSEGYLQAAAVMSLLSQWEAAEEIYEVGLLNCEGLANQMVACQLRQLRAISQHIRDTLAAI